MKIDPRRPQSKLNRSRACSSPDRAFGSGPKGSRFDSCQAHQILNSGLGSQRVKGDSAAVGCSRNAHERRQRRCPPPP